MLHVETWPIDKLIPYARNPRKNDDQVERMCGAIREFGFRIPIVARSDGTVVDGHLRLKAAYKLGMTAVPVALADELTETQVKAFRLLVNQSADWAEWDIELLRLELDDLKDQNYDLELTGFEDDELATLSRVEDESISQLGDMDKGSLAYRFGYPPFSVLNARDGEWQKRKKEWLDKGIQSELGRGGR